eukprot:Gregarina_sp_Poly_1__485@NODE_1117_length_5035_cov_49_186594_g774_i0_p1_GENE_NODE_1117_length_5035_cov_49_186594_g774_i0NODE_1117_length_5035_cov_49_186594_g774_i0_p1_ORF_typecomplete_len697_score40_65_NODE_1117_length_5035_cov_49_186594_g774_i028944984
MITTALSDVTHPTSFSLTHHIPTEGVPFEWQTDGRCQEFDYYASFGSTPQSPTVKRIEFVCVIRGNPTGPQALHIWDDRLERIFKNCEIIWNRDSCPHCHAPGHKHAVSVTLVLKQLSINPEFFENMRKRMELARTHQKEFYLRQVRAEDKCRYVDDSLAFVLGQYITSSPAVCHVFGLPEGDITDTGALYLLKSFIAIEYLPDSLKDKYLTEGPRLKYPWTTNHEYKMGSNSSNVILPWIYLKRNRIQSWIHVIEALYKKYTQLTFLPAHPWDAASELVCYPTSYGRNEVPSDKRSCSNFYCNRIVAPLFHLPKMAEQKPPSSLGRLSFASSIIEKSHPLPNSRTPRTEIKEPRRRVQGSALDHKDDRDSRHPSRQRKRSSSASSCSEKLKDGGPRRKLLPYQRHIRQVSEESCEMMLSGPGSEASISSPAWHSPSSSVDDVSDRYYKKTDRQQRHSSSGSSDSTYYQRGPSRQPLSYNTVVRPTISLPKVHNGSQFGPIKANKTLSRRTAENRDEWHTDDRSRNGSALYRRSDGNENARSRRTLPSSGYHKSRSPPRSRHQPMRSRTNSLHQGCQPVVRKHCSSESDRHNSSSCESNTQRGTSPHPLPRGRLVAHNQSLARERSPRGSSSPFDHLRTQSPARNFPVARGGPAQSHRQSPSRRRRHAPSSHNTYVRNQERSMSGSHESYELGRRH